MTPIVLAALPPGTQVKRFTLEASGVPFTVTVCPDDLLVEVSSGIPTHAATRSAWSFRSTSLDEALLLAAATCADVAHARHCHATTAQALDRVQSNLDALVAARREFA